MKALTEIPLLTNVRNGVSNWFGKVTAKVTYLDESFEISTRLP